MLITQEGLGMGATDVEEANSLFREVLIKVLARLERPRVTTQTVPQTVTASSTSQPSTSTQASTSKGPKAIQIDGIRRLPTKPAFKDKDINFAVQQTPKSSNTAKDQTKENTLSLDFEPASTFTDKSPQIPRAVANYQNVVREKTIVLPPTPGRFLAPSVLNTPTPTAVYRESPREIVTYHSAPATAGGMQCITTSTSAGDTQETGQSLMYGSEMYQFLLQDSQTAPNSN